MQGILYLIVSLLISLPSLSLSLPPYLPSSLDPSFLPPSFSISLPPSIPSFLSPSFSISLPPSIPPFLSPSLSLSLSPPPLSLPLLLPLSLQHHSVSVRTDGTRSLEENMRQTVLACYRELSEILNQLAITHVS